MAIKNIQVASTTTTQLFLASTQTAITTMFFCNVTTGTSATVNVYAVPNGSNASPGTLIMNSLILPATETFVLDTERLILEQADALYAQASTSGAVTVTISSLTTA